MSENEKRAIGLIIVTEQLEQIDLIERALKSKMGINTYTTNNSMELKKVLSKENVDLIIIDDTETTIGVGSVRSAANDLKLRTPILQLQHRSTGETDGVFIKNGASIVCAHDDALAIAHNTELLLAYVHGQTMLAKDADIINVYREKFDDLYQGLADPICYVQDGVFIDCNPAFLRVFEVSDKAEFDELTILNFVERKNQSDFKGHLRKSMRRDMSASPIVFSMQTKLGKPVEFSVMSKPSSFGGEEAVQIYLRSTSDGGVGGASLFDETTGLSNREQMTFFVEQKLQQFEQKGGQGFLVYLQIKNYRDVWGSDGFAEAEKFIKAIVVQVRKTLPAHTEVSRYTDDGLLMYIPGEDPQEIGGMLAELIGVLDKLTPEGMTRMVEPMCYASYETFDKNSDYLMVVSAIFRTARNASLTEGMRVGAPTNVEVAKNDKRRLQILQDIIKDETMEMRFQPIASFDPDGMERYRERLMVTHEDDDDLDLEEVVATAERYELMHQIDKWKMNLLFNKLLGMNVASRKNLQVFVLLSADSLKNVDFCGWLVQQLQHTGLEGRHFVFELVSDSVVNAYTGAVKLAKAVRKCGAKVAISKVGGLQGDNERILNDMKPDIIKLDLREIDTLDDNEESEVMGALKAKADELGAMVIAEYLTSPGQLSRIWPYDVTFVQGDGMTPVLDDMDFSFDEFAI